MATQEQYKEYKKEYARIRYHYLRGKLTKKEYNTILNNLRYDFNIQIRDRVYLDNVKDKYLK